MVTRLYKPVAGSWTSWATGELPGPPEAGNTDMLGVFITGGGGCFAVNCCVKLALAVERLS